jgi:hypothetical protein
MPIATCRINEYQVKAIKERTVWENRNNYISVATLKDKPTPLIRPIQVVFDTLHHEMKIKYTTSTISAEDSIVYKMNYNYNGIIKFQMLSKQVFEKNVYGNELKQLHQIIIASNRFKIRDKSILFYNKNKISFSVATWSYELGRNAFDWE